MTGRPRPLPPELPYTVFTATEARRAGISASRLRASDLRSLGHDLWARTDGTVTERDIVAALCRRDRHVFAAGLTAARLWGFPLPGSLGRDVVAAPSSPRRVDGRWVYRPGGRAVDTRIHMGTSGTLRRESALVRWSRLSVDHLRLGGEPGVRLTSRIRTLLDLAGILGQDDLVIIGDHLVRMPRPALEGRADPHATVDELAEIAGHFHGRGAGSLREAMAQARVSSDSPAETRLRLAVVRAGLPEPLVNVRAVVNSGEGRELVDLGEPDLHWPRWRVALEHEGPRHLRAEQLPRDIARAERREKAGWIEVRTTAGDLGAGCRKGVARVRDALLRQGWQPS